ncbi:MAG: GAF domain-containing protein [Desulfobulbaceae bacterium]|nr:GAF domain-containing protein [Desulfobulbaceae bacterium]
MITEQVGLERQDKFIKVFQKVTRFISMDLDHQQVMDTIVGALPELLDVDAVTIRLLDASTNTFVLGASHGLSLEYLSRQGVDTAETMEMVKCGYPVAKSIQQEDSTDSESELARREGIKSILSLPVLFQDSIIGVMRLLTRTTRSFSSGEISFSMALAEQIGIAISNARMIKEMENQVDFMKEIQELSRLVNSTLDLDEVLNTIVARLPVSLGRKACTIRLVQPQTNQLELVAAYGVSDEFHENCSIESEKNSIMVLTDEPVTIFNAEDDDRVLCKEHLRAEGIKSILAVPLKVNNEIIGVLRILSAEQHCFTSSEVNFAVTAAESGGMAIQNARTYRKINLLFNQIEENERFMGDILDCIHAQLLVVDRSRHVVLVNKTFLEAVGKKEEEVLGMEYPEFYCSGDLEGDNCPVDLVIQHRKSASLIHQATLEDETYWFERTSSPMIGEDGEVEYVIEVIRDITAKRNLEDEQMRRMKLEGVIEMAGTVAHEINTPLFAALGTAQLMRDDYEEEDIVGEIEVIIRNLKEISELTKKMTTMTGFENRSYVGETTIVDLK